MQGKAKQRALLKPGSRNIDLVMVTKSVATAGSAPHSPGKHQQSGTAGSCNAGENREAGSGRKKGTRHRRCLGCHRGTKTE